MTICSSIILRKATSPPSGCRRLSRLVAFAAFSVFCGSALSGEGVEALMDALSSLLAPPPVLEGAASERALSCPLRCQGRPLGTPAHFAGSLAPKQVVGREKVHELRIFKGTVPSPPRWQRPARYALSGLSLRPGGAIGLPGLPQPRLQPALSAEVLYPDDVAPQRVAAAFGQLEDEETRSCAWPLMRKHTAYIQLMGKIQLEVLSARCPGGLGSPFPLAPAASCTAKPSQSRYAAMAILSRCAIMPRCIFSLHRARGSGLFFDSVVPTDTLPFAVPAPDPHPCL